MVLTLGVDYPTPVRKVMESEQFILRDKLGKSRAVLETGAEGEPIISLLDGRGDCRLKLSVSGPSGTPSISFHRDGKRNCAITAIPSGQNGGALSMLSMYWDDKESLRLSNYGLAVIDFVGNQFGAGGDSIILEDKNKQTIFQVRVPKEAKP
jgi:hypothetical protein